MTQDSLLIERAKAGDADAYGEIVRQFQSDVRAFLKSRILDEATADDLAQEVFIGGFRSIRNFEGSSSLRSWLISIAKNKLMDFFRSETRKKALHAKLQLEINGQNEHRIGHQCENDFADIVDSLKKCVEGLKPNARKLVGKFYYDDCSAVQIGIDIEQKPSSVRMHLLRIRRSLAKCIRQRIGRDIAL